MYLAGWGLAIALAVMWAVYQKRKIRRARIPQNLNAPPSIFIYGDFPVSTTCSYMRPNDPTPRHRAVVEYEAYQTRTKHESHTKPAPREEDRDE